MKKWLFIAGFVFIHIMAIGQDVEKTVELDEVIINGLPFEKFTSGSKMEKSDSLVMAVLGQKTLSDYLQQNSTVYIKEQGNAMLASVSFRGTGSSHTGVFWHGINLNSLTLGSSDFNGIPLFLFDGLAVQYGGASSVHGSDAIGGSIHLSSLPAWNPGVRVQLRQDFGSFGNIFTGAKVEFGNGIWESKTAVFNKSLQNNFTYTVTDRLGKEYDIEQQNASVHNYALLQQFHRKVGNNGHLSFKGWYGNNQHQIQPLMVTSPDQPQPGDELHDENLRLIAAYDHYFKRAVLQTSTAYVWDYQVYNNSDVIETRRVLADIQHEWNLSTKTTVRAGGNVLYIDPEVWSYSSDVSEWRSDVFMSASHELLTNWLWNLNIRKTWVPFTDSPVAPALSTSYSVVKPNITLTSRAQAEKSYRIPTFNDRYWGELGRKDLESENGYSVEIGQNLVYTHGRSSLEGDVSAYFMNVDNWIAWKPAGGIWRPFNLKEVAASGIEISGKYGISLPNGRLEVGAMYAFNHTELLKGIGENDPAVGYQLPYTPKHRAVFHSNLILKSYRFSINNSYTGVRYGMDVINERLDGFLKTDITFAKNFSMGKNTISFEAQVLNVFDVAYQNVENYAMPGRNYLLSVNFLFNN